LSRGSSGGRTALSEAFAFWIRPRASSADERLDARHLDAGGASWPRRRGAAGGHAARAARDAIVRSAGVRGRGAVAAVRPRAAPRRRARPHAPGGGEIRDGRAVAHGRAPERVATMLCRSRRPATRGAAGIGCLRSPAALMRHSATELRRLHRLRRHHRSSRISPLRCLADGIRWLPRRMATSMGWKCGQCLWDINPFVQLLATGQGLVRSCVRANTRGPAFSRSRFNRAR